jgi:hypothetical protein
MTEEPRKPGPVPEHLKIDEDWEEAVKKVLQKQQPPEGWPKPDQETNTKKEGRESN